MKLNGWKRIGIIASVVWAFGAYFHEFNSVYNGTVETYTSISHDCLERANNGGNETGQQCEQDLRQSVDESFRSAREAGIFVALVPIPLVWVGAYLALFLARWIRKGFVSADDNQTGFFDSPDQIPEGHSPRRLRGRVQVLISSGAVVLIIWLIYGRIQANRVIADDQGTIADLTAKQKAVDERPPLELQSRCSEAAKQFFSREWSAQDSDYTSHYNPDLRKCFITVKTSRWQKSTGTVLTSKNVYDAVEGKTYGEYLWQSDRVKKWWEVPPIQCDGITADGDEAVCHSEAEYENLMSKYMDISD